MAITGASGGAYARRLAQGVVAAGARLHLVISSYGARTLAGELDLHDPTPEALLDGSSAHRHAAFLQ